MNKTQDDHCYAAHVPPLDVSTRREKILRYRAKRLTRRFSHTSKYYGKQIHAGQRLRVKGRFVGKAAEKALAGLEDCKNNVTMGQLLGLI